MKLAIVGSTCFTDTELHDQVVPIISKWVLEWRPEAIISGGAVGVDKMAAVAAVFFSHYLDQKIELIQFLPEHPRWEPEGYKDRNLKIAQECDLLLAIRSRWSRTYGSGWTADQAEQMGKEVVRVTL